MLLSYLWCRDGSVLFINRFGYLWGHCGSPANPLPTNPAWCCRQGLAQHLSLFLCWQTGSWRPPARAGLIVLDESSVSPPFTPITFLRFLIHSDVSWHAWWASSIQSVAPYSPMPLLRPQQGRHYFHRGHGGFQGLLAVSWVVSVSTDRRPQSLHAQPKTFAPEPRLPEPAHPLIPFSCSCLL